MSNLTSQNEKLKSEVTVLTNKVGELMESRKMPKNKNPQIEQEVARLKK
jgi:peptidoglycan hydrolase CwlO-like protein